MSKYLIDSETLTDIADSIREKTGGTDPINVSDMPSEIEGITTGDTLHRELTSAQYNALTTEERNNGTLYFITDAGNENEVTSLRHVELTRSEYNALTPEEQMNGTLYLVKNSAPVVCERLFYLRCYNNDYNEIPQASSWNKGDNFDNYVSYDSSTRKFTVLQDFTGLIVAWVYTYQTYESSRSDGAFYINGKQIGQYEATANAAGSKGGSYFTYPFKTGDTFWPYTPTRDGYPQQNLKVYIVSDQDDGVWSFTDEEA